MLAIINSKRIFYSTSRAADIDAFNTEGMTDARAIFGSPFC
jgi:hypothetical protein